MIRLEPIKARPKKRADINGWAIEKRPNSFAERYAYEATAVDANGYLTARQGFSTMREAKAYCEATQAPRERPKKRSPYRGGKTVSALKPWLSEDPPMSRRTWYRHQAKKKEQAK